MGDDMAAKKDQKLTCMLDESMAADLARLAFANDLTPSELVRSCITLALPVFTARPSLIQVLPTLPAMVDRELTR